MSALTQNEHVRCIIGKLSYDYHISLTYFGYLAPLSLNCLKIALVITSTFMCFGTQTESKTNTDFYRPFYFHGSHPNINIAREMLIKTYENMQPEKCNLLICVGVFSCISILIKAVSTWKMDKHFFVHLVA